MPNQHVRDFRGGCSSSGCGRSWHHHGPRQHLGGEQHSRTIEILVDEVDAEGAIGRSSADAPEIDGRVYLDGATGLQPGDFVEAEVNAADDYDLWAG